MSTVSEAVDRKLVFAGLLGALGLAGMIAACTAATGGTGKGTGKETEGCYQGAFCDADLQCIYGYCVAQDDEADEADDTDDVGESNGSSELDSDEGPEPDLPIETCGNAQLDRGEACDGALLAGQSCTSLGWDRGTLACAPDCQLDLEGCNNAPQPGLGELYSPCLTNDSCPGLDACATVIDEGQQRPLAGFCTNFCTSDADCWLPTGGSAMPRCNGEVTSYCVLDCSGGLTCPQGMDCLALMNGDEVCY